jgi:hypothetical protein
VVLRSLAGAHQVEAVPLDGGGRPLGKPTVAERTMVGWRLPLGGVVTAWYVIEVKRR